MEKVLELHVSSNSIEADIRRDELIIEGKEICAARELWGTPEDARFGRDLITSFDVADYIKRGIDIYVEGGYTDIEIIYNYCGIED